jgi:penicillin-binding protein 1A
MTRFLWRLYEWPLIFIFIFIFFLAAVDTGIFGHLKSLDELKGLKNETASVVYSTDHVIIGKFFDENRTNITFDQLPPHLINALLATEDVRYFEHTGVDAYSLIRVFFKSILMGNRSSGGGSTITQQLAKNLLGRKRGGVFAMVVNKAKEAIQANRIEKAYNKEEILTLYLNTVPFGENVFGIETAAQRFFNKKVNLLSLDESAVLIGILKANTFYNPRLNPNNALRRRNVVMKQMMKYDFITKNDYDSLNALPLTLDYANLSSEGPANYFLKIVKNEAKEILDSINENGSEYDLLRDGLIIETTLNAQYQQYALGAFKSHLSSMQTLLNQQYSSGLSKRNLDRMANQKLAHLGESRNANTKTKAELFSWDTNSEIDSVTLIDSIKHALTLLHAGLIAIDPNYGGIQIYVGGIDFITQPYDQVMARRQLASTFKPILYAAALESGYGPCDYLKNDSIVFEEYEGWTPQNYDHSTGGKYSMAAALAKSMNIPTVHLYEDVGYRTLASTWKNLGFKSKLNNSPSTALGTADASIYELAVAYASFANGGNKIKPYSIKSIKTAEGKVIYQKNPKLSETEVISQESADIMSMMLRKAVTSGTGVSLKNKYGVALPFSAKTGTSQNYGDAWFVAMNQKMVIVTRVGASSNQVHFRSGAQGSGSKLALPIVALTLKKIQDNLSDEALYDFNIDPNIIELQLIYDCEDYKEEPLIKELIEELFENFRIQKDRKKRQVSKPSTERKTPKYQKSKRKKKKPKVWKKKKKHFK